ncbi:response regulator transcription factor [Sphingobacterium sp. DN00404]|uniref:Response regulator transcription factor n=1 Tax=Sphingobacterium micropteri TaxID=2763501 RepID=A0ABR7YNP7_9SPHI|nr:response regulator transcription factor [Sphingobacterium micropteri]MBD1432861.1 response regulator transcription factor [Sphingobacterium micropteri]
MRNKILIIEDDKELALTLKDFFEENALQVWHASSGEEGLSLYYKENPDLIILDVVLPDESGFDVIADIRDKDITTPIIMMTGTEFDEDNQMRGYDGGANNYMQKPVYPQVLLAQIKNILSLPKDLLHYKIGGMKIRLHTQYIEFDGKSHPLRERDFEILTLLFQHQGQVVDRSVILKQVWKDDRADNNGLLDAAMSRIRRIVKEYPTVQIKTIYGVGYMLTDKINSVTSR